MATDFSWTPPLVVLALGAVAGAVAVSAWVRRRGSANREVSRTSSDRSDLQHRYDALIRRLAEESSPEGRAALEIEAALVLREMETGATSNSLPKQALSGKQIETTATPIAARPTPAWLGFVYGALSMGVLGGLFFLASQGSSPRAENGSPTGGNSMGSSSETAQASAADEQAVLAQVQALEEAVSKTPKDIGQRIELTRAYLRRRDLMKVFEQTKAILEIEPGNPHALTYQALVRVAMGQAAQAESMLLEVLKKEPRIEDAYIHLAIARLQLGNRAGAEDAIHQGQKQFPEDAEQLAQVLAQISSAGGDGKEAVPENHPEVASPAMGAPESVAGSSAAEIIVVVDLPKGVTVPETAILFVIAREAGLESGAPAAVKRVPARDFPITVTLSSKDSMAGEGLPGLARIEARVDRDGDPLTKDPRDPKAIEDNVRPGGGQVFLVLAPAGQ